MKNIKLFPQGLLESNLIEEYLTCVRNFLTSDNILPANHPSISSLENNIGKCSQAEYCITTSSGTTALTTILSNLDLAPNARIITTPFTYQATVGSIVLSNLQPVFCDIDAETLQIDDLKLKELIDDSIHCILKVNLNGSYCSIPNSISKAQSLNIKIIEDSAQRFPCFLQKEIFAQALSFGPTKNIMGFAESGAILTDDKDLAQKSRIWIKNGGVGNFLHTAIGCNGVMDPMCAGILSINLSKIKQWNDHRKLIAQRYDQNLQDLAEIKLIKRDDISTSSKYTVWIHDQRDKLKEFLLKNYIEVAVYYPHAQHLQPCFKHLGYQKGDFPLAEKATLHVLSLPIHPYINFGHVDYICKKIREFYA